MRKFRPSRYWLVAGCVFGLSAPELVAAQEDAPAAAQACVACHGINGVSSNPIVPTLAGQPFTLIEDNLLAFRAEQRVCAITDEDQSPAGLLGQAMCSTVADLKNEEIVELAAFFEAQDFIAAKQDFEAALIEQGQAVHLQSGCEHCHSNGGRQTNAMAPLLAGQWTPYLRQAMEKLRKGERKGPKVMNEAIDGLRPNEVEALLQFYASQQTKGPNDSIP